MTLLHADRSFARATTARQTSTHPSHQPSTLPGRRSPRTGKPASVVSSTAADPLVRRQLARTPEEKLWLAVFSTIHSDSQLPPASPNHFSPASLDLDQACILDFVAWALGWPTDTLPRIFEKTEEERARGRRKGMKLVSVEGGSR